MQTSPYDLLSASDQSSVNSYTKASFSPAEGFNKTENGPSSVKHSPYVSVINLNSHKTAVSDKSDFISAYSALISDPTKLPSNKPSSLIQSQGQLRLDTHNPLTTEIEAKSDGLDLSSEASSALNLLDEAIDSSLTPRQSGLSPFESNSLRQHENSPYNSSSRTRDILARTVAEAILAKLVRYWCCLNTVAWSSSVLSFFSFFSLSLSQTSPGFYMSAAQVL